MITNLSTSLETLGNQMGTASQASDAPPSRSPNNPARAFAEFISDLESESDIAGANTIDPDELETEDDSEFVTTASEIGLVDHQSTKTGLLDRRISENQPGRNQGIEFETKSSLSQPIFAEAKPLSAVHEQIAGTVLQSHDSTRPRDIKLTSVVEVSQTKPTHFKPESQLSEVDRISRGGAANVQTPQGAESDGRFDPIRLDQRQNHPQTGIEGVDVTHLKATQGADKSETSLRPVIERSELLSTGIPSQSGALTYPQKIADEPSRESAQSILRHPVDDRNFGSQDVEFATKSRSRLDSTLPPQGNEVTFQQDKKQVSPQMIRETRVETSDQPQVSQRDHARLEKRSVEPNSSKSLTEIQVRENAAILRPNALDSDSVVKAKLVGLDPQRGSLMQDGFMSSDRFANLSSSKPAVFLANVSYPGQIEKSDYKATYSMQGERVAAAQVSELRHMMVAQPDEAKLRQIGVASQATDLAKGSEVVPLEIDQMPMPELRSPESLSGATHRLDGLGQVALPETTQTTVHRMESARFAAQMAETMVRQSGRSVELVLNPEELGRLRVSMSPTDTGMVVTLSAERPETLDLMRRYIDNLASALRDLGHGDVTFDFQGGKNPQTNSPSVAISENETTEPSLTAAPRKVLAPNAATSGLDMRL